MTKACWERLAQRQGAKGDSNGRAESLPKPLLRKFSMRAHHILSASTTSESVLWSCGIESDAHSGSGAVRLCSSEFEEYMIIATTRNQHAGWSALRNTYTLSIAKQRFQISDSSFQILDVRFQISVFRFQISDFRFQIPGFRFQILDFRFQILDFRFQISYFRFQISDFRFHILDFRFQVADFRF